MQRFSHFYTNTQPNGILFRGPLIRLITNDCTVAINTDTNAEERNIHEQLYIDRRRKSGP